MSGFIKKNWFICIIALLLAGVSAFFIYDTNKGKLKGKSADGEDVVYEINGEDVTASAYYDMLYEDAGNQAVYALFEKAVLAGIEPTDEMKAAAAAQAQNVIANYRTSYPTNYQDVLTRALRQVGYSSYEDLEEYMLQYQKYLQVGADYARAHTEDLKVRNISYILIKLGSDSTPETTPTADEQARKQAVDDALAAGTDFAEVAKQYSEDSSTAAAGGVLGTIDVNTTSLDTAFQDAALALNEGEVSDWVYSPNFGYFRIRNNASTAESLAALQEASGTDPYQDLIYSYYMTVNSRALWERAQELGMTFNEDLEGMLKETLGITD
ncbi:MAG: peptidylprolyl isomerase [Solobacterium sp.]|nr:peptidylprolyl isomerase [Solobacterium sp.]